MITDFMAVSGYVFWLVVLAVSILDLFILYDDENNPVSFGVFVTLAALVGAYAFTDAFVGVKWTTLLIGVVAYLIVGVVWSFKKWYTFLVESRNKLKEFWDRPANDKAKTPWPQYAVDNRPNAKDNKERIVAWMTLWPWSVLWWVLEWPRRLFNWIYDHLKKVYDSIAEKVFQ